MFCGGVPGELGSRAGVRNILEVSVREKAGVRSGERVVAIKAEILPTSPSVSTSSEVKELSKLGGPSSGSVGTTVSSWNMGTMDPAVDTTRDFSLTLSAFVRRMVGSAGALSLESADEIDRGDEGPGVKSSAD